MNNLNRLNIIKKRLQNFFSPSILEVIDESELHVGHAGYQGGGRHFAINISAKYFDNLSRVKAHQKIYDVLRDMMPDQIHALRIKILSSR